MTPDPRVEEVQKEHFTARIDKVCDYYSAVRANPGRWGGGGVPVNTGIEMNNQLPLLMHTLCHCSLCVQSMFDTLPFRGQSSSTCFTQTLLALVATNTAGLKAVVLVPQTGSPACVIRYRPFALQMGWGGGGRSCQEIV